MFGLSLRLWQEGGGEEEFTMLLPGLCFFPSFLDTMLALLEKEAILTPKEVALLVSLAPPDLLKPTSTKPSSWSAAKTLRKTRENLQRVQREGESKKQGSSKGESETEEPETDVQFNDDLMETQESGNNLYSRSDEEEDGDENVNNDIDPEVAARPPRKVKSEFECVVCGEVFPLLKELRAHQELSHKELYCPKCGTASPTPELVLEHNCSKPHACTVCRRLFSTGHELKSHLYIRSGEKPHQCDGCGKGFRQKATLDRHKLTHETKRNFDCDECGKKFKFKHYLVSHKLLHTGDKPHMCTWCGVKFAQNANMQKHIRQKHTNDKSHVCRYCGKAFVQAYYLRRHMNSHKEAAHEKATLAQLVETHTGSDEQVGIRTVSCRLCSATCKGEKELGEHMRRRHLETQEEVYVEEEIDIEQNNLKDDLLENKFKVDDVEHTFTADSMKNSLKGETIGNNLRVNTEEKGMKVDLEDLVQQPKQELVLDSILASEEAIIAH